MAIPAAVAVPAVAGLLGGVTSNIFGARTARQNVDKTIQANRELAAYGYYMDKKQWERENAYNAPAAQMQRLRDAGLNPHLVYGKGSVVGNTSTSGPKYQAPRESYEYQNPVANLGPILSEAADLAIKSAQMDNIKAQTEATRTKTALDVIRKDTTKSIQEQEYLKANIARSTWQDQVYLKQAQATAALQNLKKTEREIGLLDEKVIAQKLENEIKAFRNKWEKEGFTPSDRKYLKAAKMLFINLGVQPSEWLQELFKGLD
jgi:hypothetical protein